MVLTTENSHELMDLVNYVSHWCLSSTTKATMLRQKWRYQAAINRSPVRVLNGNGSFIIWKIRIDHVKCKFPQLLTWHDQFNFSFGISSSGCCCIFSSTFLQDKNLKNDEKNINSFTHRKIARKDCLLALLITITYVPL